MQIIEMMRNMLLFLCVVLFSLPGFPQSSHRGFFRDYNTAIQEANELGQILMIGFYEESCFLSKQLEQEVYHSKEFMALTDEMACVKVNIDTDEGSILEEKYRIPGCPTVLFTNGAGLELERITSFVPKGEFLEEVFRILSGNTIPAIEARISESPVYQDLFLATVYYCRNDYQKDKLDRYCKLFKELDPVYEKDSTNALFQYVYRKEIQRGVGSIGPEAEEFLFIKPGGNNYKLAVLLANYYLKMGDKDHAWAFFSDFYMMTDKRSKVESYFQKIKKVTGHEDKPEPAKKHR